MIGVLNKLVTVALNILLWDKHSSPLGTAFLLVCLAGGAFYEQAPLRARPAAFAKLEDAALDRGEVEAAPSSVEAAEVEAGAPGARR
jgi:GDP-mannose transporter